MRKLMILGSLLIGASSFIAKGETPLAYWVIMSEEARTAALRLHPQILGGTVEFPSVVTSRNGNEYKVTWLDGFESWGGDADCSGVTDAVLPESLEIISTFVNLTGLRSLPLPKTLRKITRGSFYNCVSLDSIGFPEGLIDIGVRSFYGCKSLSTIVFPSTVFTIPKCFENCDNLNTVVMGKFVKELDKDLFKTNPRLQKVYFIGWEDNNYIEGFSEVFTADREVSPEVGKVQIYVPPMYMNAYAHRLPSDYEKYYDLLPCPDLFAVFNKECFKVEEGESVPLLYRMINPKGIEIADVEWESLSPKAVSVENGVAKGLKTGEITRISLKITDTEKNTYVSECRVEVIKNTGIEEIEQEKAAEIPDANVNIYDLKGVLKGNSTNNLPTGMYLKTQGNHVEKIVVK